MNQSLPDKILDTIKKTDLKPLSPFEIFLRRAIYWFFFILSSILGGSIIAMLVLHFKMSDLPFYPLLADNIFFFFFRSIPYFWLIIYFGFVSFSYFSLRHTAHGYKWSFFKSILANLATTLLLGLFVYKFGLPAKIDKALESGFPIYKSMELKKIQKWNHPEKGLLTGELTDFRDQQFYILDSQGRQWVVFPINQEAIRIQNPTIGIRVKVFGRQSGVQNFEALMIAEWNEKIPPKREYLLKLKENFPATRIK